MKSIKDEVLGELEYEYGWNREYEITIFNEKCKVRLIIENYDETYPEKQQKVAFLHFQKNRKSIVCDVEYKLFQYYIDNLSEIRAKIDEDSWELKAPKLDNGDVERFKKLVKPTTIYIPQTFDDEESLVYGVIFSCTWEDECGIAVKFENELITVGTDDIILM